MAKNKYSKLPIDVSKIYDWINLWCESEFGIGNYKIISRDNSPRIQYLIKCESKEIKLDFIKCTGGLLTIAPNVGTQQELSHNLADSIYDRVKDINKDSKFANGFSIKLPEEDYQTIIDLISEEQGNTILNRDVMDEPGKANYVLHRIKGKLGDTVVIKFFPHTSRMQLQGKPAALFNEIVAMISEGGADLNDVVDAQLNYCSLELNRNEVLEEMEQVLGRELYHYLTSSQKAILSSAFILSKISMELPDNSVIVQQAFRAYEGVLKKLLRDQNITLDEGEMVGSVFKHVKETNQFQMKSEYAAIVDDPTKEKTLTVMYQFYFQHRHPYSHASDNDLTTAIIGERKVADELFNEAIQYLKTGYASLK